MKRKRLAQQRNMQYPESPEGGGEGGVVGEVVVVGGGGGVVVESCSPAFAPLNFQNITLH